MADIKNSFDLKTVAPEIINILAKYNIQIDGLDIVFKYVHDEIMRQRISYVETKNEGSVDIP